MAVAVLIFFGWQCLDPYQVVGAQSVQPPPPASSLRRHGSAREFDESVRALKQLAIDLDRASTEGKDLTDLQKLDDLRQPIEAADATIRASFQQIAAKLKASGVPAEILARNDQASAKYSANLEQLRSDLDAIRRARQDLDTAQRRRDAAAARAASDQLRQQIAQLRAHLEASVEEPPHTPLDPDNLPFRAPKAKERKPRLRKEDFNEPQKLGDVASIGDPFSVVGSQDPSGPPGTDDLSETIDVQLTPGIRALAASLGQSPVAIFNWVRQNVAFVPTFGSIQGSEACRLSQECNAHDTASLLIALLRASGIPARYAIGTVELKPDLFRRGMGDFQDVEAAGRFASSGGIPVSVVNDGTGKTVAVRMEHVWVEAYLDYVPSRAAVKGPGEIWVALDAAIKPMQFQRPLDIINTAGVDLQATFDAIKGATGDDANPVTGISQAQASNGATAARQQLRTYIESTMPDATVGDVLGALRIDARSVSVLPASLPERVLVVGGRFTELPATSRHQVTIRIVDRFGISEQIRVDRPTAALAGKRLTVGYFPATQADIATIDSFGGLFNTPPYLVNLRPVVYLDGVVMGSGSPVGMGTIQKIQVSFSEPDGASDNVEHTVTAGTYAALGLDLQRVSRQALEARKSRLDATRSAVGVQDVNWDDMLGETLHLHALTYFLQTEGSNRITANQLNVAALKRPAEMLATFSPAFGYLFGAAVDVIRTGMNVDVRRYNVSVSSRTGARDRERSYMLTTGMFASAAEHSVFEHLQNARSVSAVKLIAEASNRGIPVFAIDATNLATILPQLRVSTAVLNDIRNSVASGKRVLIPRDNVPYLDWQGVGYIVADPETGAAGYLISGGLAGGGTAEQSTVGDILQQIIQILGFLLQEFTTIAGALRVLSKAAAWAERIGQVVAAISAIATGYSMYSDTGSIWKGLAAGLIDLGLSLASGAAITFLAGTGLGLIGMIVAVVVITAIVILIENLILEVIKNASLIILERYAVAPVLRGWPVPTRLSAALGHEFALGAVA